MTHGSLFAGIGGFDLGFERAGIKTVWQVEIDPFCRSILERHFPTVRRFPDVRTCGAENLERVDIIAGGFPCHDISRAGKREGITGEQSRLWIEYRRIIAELAPAWAVIENVGALTHRGLSVVLTDLHEIGYDAEWQIIPAWFVGSPQVRERTFIVAYPCQPGEAGWRSERIGWWSGGEGEARQNGWSLDAEIDDKLWREPRVDRVAYGIPAQVDRINKLGNAIVPQIAEWIGRRIIEAEKERISK